MTTQNRELASLIDSSGNVTATGNLTVSGTTTAVSSTNTTVTDPLIELNNGAGSNSNDLGFVFERGSTGNNACLIWDESNDAFAVGTTTATGTSTGNMSYTTGDFLAGKITVDNVIINGTTIGHTDDTDLMTLADGVLTVAGEVDAASLDISGNADIDGTLETDNLTVGGQQGSDGQVLTSTGSGVAWEAPAVTAVANGSDNRIATFSSSTALNGEANLTFDGSTLSATHVASAHTGGLKIINSQAGGYGSALTFQSERSDNNALVDAARIRTEGADSWNSDASTDSTFKIETATDNSLTEKFRITKDGQILANALGVTVPTFAFINDTNTGMTRPTGDTLQMICNGSQAMRITETLVTIAAGHISMADSAGNVSVGHEALNVVQANSGDSNTAMGYQALEKVTDGIHNTGMGYRTGMEITTGARNVLMGNFAGDAITTASNNTFIGYGAGTGNTSGYDNVAVGRNSFDANTEGHSNTAVGESSLTSNTTGDRNIAIGQNSMAVNTTGSENVGIGRNALDANTTASNNVAVGDGALTANTTGDVNTAIGTSALATNTTASNNVAVGRESLFSNTTGALNTAVGNAALYNNTTASNNVAIGYQAMFTNTTGTANVCIGYQAGTAMSGNDHNTCVGSTAGVSITSGGSNTIMGSQAGDALTTAHNNTLIGTRAGTTTTTGNGYNTAIGVDALEDCTTGSFNVSLGTNAIGNVTSGANNIGIGYRAGKAGQPGGTVTSHSNRVCLGDTAISEFNCQVSLSVASDQRDKTDFTALNLGLDFVKSLTPYTFKWDKRSNYVDWDTNPDTDLLTITNNGTHKETQLDIGFKAQDVEALEVAAGYNRDAKTNLTYALSADGKQYSMKYEKLVPILVKAIQELEARVATLES